MEHEMMINSQKVKVSDEVLNARSMKQKRIEVTTARGVTIKVSEHMLNDLAKFGAMRARPNVKQTPRELLKTIVPKQVILPGDILPEKIEPALNPLPEMKVEETFDKAPVKRKAPVKAKAK
jgi:hypothetical protein